MVYLTPLSVAQSGLLSVVWYDWLLKRIEKYMKGSGLGLIEALSHHFHNGSEE
jgi:hypothetical protein